MADTIKVASRWPMRMMMGTTVLNGAGHNEVGITEGVDAKAFAAWLDANKDMPIVTSGSVYELKDGDDGAMVSTVTPLTSTSTDVASSYAMHPPLPAGNEAAVPAGVPAPAPAVPDVVVPPRDDPMNATSTAPIAQPVPAPVPTPVPVSAQTGTSSAPTPSAPAPKPAPLASSKST